MAEHQKRAPRPRFVVIVPRGGSEQDVYGPYEFFRVAEGDAKAWGGYVEPLLRPCDHVFTKGE